MGIAYLTQSEHYPISRYDNICVRGKGAFQDAVVGFVSEDCEGFPGSDHMGVLVYPRNHRCHFSIVTAEFDSEDADQFVNDGLGYEQYIQSRSDDV